jgi:hypothetical protein
VETASHETSGPYATLSYCWGGNIKFRLTTSSLQQFKTGFARSSLPQTIKDAVQVTMQLGLRYLWVDSLCIIQDSPEDWAAEVESMSDVCRNCHVTIAALGALNSDQGLWPFSANATLSLSNLVGCLQLQVYRDVIVTWVLLHRALRLPKNSWGTPPFINEVGLCKSGSCPREL